MQGSCCSSWDALNTTLLQVHPKLPAPGTWADCFSCSTSSLKLRGDGCAMNADLTKQAKKMLRTQVLSRCRNHGFLVPVKGHAGKCRWKQCTCEKCYLITERQKIVAAQRCLKQASGESRRWPCAHRDPSWPGARPPQAQASARCSLAPWETSQPGPRAKRRPFSLEMLPRGARAPARVPSSAGSGRPQPRPRGP